MMVRNVGVDCLSETVKQAIYRDAPALFSPAPLQVNRGTKLELEWDKHLGPNFRGRSLASMAADEKAGWRPSLVFSPMLVEDGRRVLISNLNLDFLAVSTGCDLSNPNESHAIYSRNAYQFAKLFPLAWPDFPVRTAVRMSASFPYMSPAAVLPTEPRRRVVDAGYYDNYGVSVGGGYVYELVAHHRPWLLQNVSGIVLIQIRDGVSDLENDSTQQRPDPGAFGRGTEWLTSPIEGMFAVRNSVSTFRNDAMLERLSHLCDALSLPRTFFTTAVFEYGGDTSMSWYMTQGEVEDVLNRAATMSDPSRHPEPESSDARNQIVFQNLRNWWHDQGASELKSPP